MRADAPSTLCARIDQGALADNARAIRERIGDRTLMAIVKGDAYGHGIAHTVAPLLEAGVRRFGVATCAEALDVHDLLTALPHGDEATLLFWIHDRTTDLTPAVARGIEVGVSTAAGFARAHAAALAAGRTARVHLKADTGLGRGGLSPAQLTELLSSLAQAPAGGTDALPDGSPLVLIVGLMSHLANADLPGDPDTAVQAEAFAAAHQEVRAFLAGPGGRFAAPEGLATHTANSPGALGPDAVPGDVVRVGLSLYGLSPFESITADQLGLRPVMTLASRVLAVKEVPAGHGASYGLTFRTQTPTRFALIAGGYADGLPRAASGRAQVSVRGTRYPVVGRIAMDQLILDVGDGPVEEGDDAIVLGDGTTGPSAEEWAAWAGTINYEIVTRVGARVDRVPVPAAETAAEAAVTRTVRLADRAGVAELAAAIGAAATPGDVLVLTGNLGAGKTTFTQFLARSLDVRGRVSSPTFVIAREHPPRGTGPGLVHVDAYRLSGAAEFDDLGLDSSLDESVTVVEWGRGLAENLGDHLDVEILRPDEAAAASDHPDNLDAATHCGDDADVPDDEPRVVTLTAHGPGWAGRLASLTLPQP